MHKKHKRLWALLTFWAISFGAFAQEKFTINGYVKEASSGEGVIGASVYVKEKGTGVATNTYGFYSITLPKGSYTLVFSSVGFQQLTKRVELNSNEKLDVELLDESKQLQEVVVKAEAEDKNVKSLEMSVNRLEIKAIKKIPALLGEVDLVRAIQLLPGVSTIGEGASGFNVRGGSVDQNLILLDDAPLYNSSHLFGFFSVFNPDAVKDVKLYKGGIPSQFGGRIASILDVKMKEGNAKKLEVNGGIGLIFSRLSIEAPIIKDKMSFIVAARRSYVDVLAQPFLTGNNKDAKFNFYDLTAKVNYIIDKKNTVFLSGYFGRDVFGQDVGFNWGNATASLRWNHVFNPRLFMNTTAYYSNYDYLLDSDLKNKRPNDAFRWNSNIINRSFKADFTYYINPQNTLTFGGQALGYNFKPGEANATSNGELRTFGLKDKKALELSAYLGNEQKVSEKFSLQYGLRFSNYAYSSDEASYIELLPDFINDPSRNTGFKYVINTPGENISTYSNFEPRFSMKYELGEQSSLKLSYNRMAQYVHLLSNTAATTPLDVWTSSTNNIKPQVADQVALGYFKNFGGETGNGYETSVEVFYKEMQNQIDYKDRSTLFLNPLFENQLMFGKGRSFGAEFFLKKNTGKLTGWISYTLSKSERQIGELNKGDWFPTRFDRRHNLNIVAQYEAGKKWSFSSNFALASGTPYSIASQTAVIDGWEVPLQEVGVRSNTIQATYYRLDVSATKKTKWNIFKKGEGELVFSIYNLLNRRNPFAYYPKLEDVNTTQLVQQDYRSLQTVRFSVIGTMIPSVTYNFKF
jgi:hypothetical protein